MYSKPVVTKELELIHTAYKVDFDLRNNITMLMGNSGSEKQQYLISYRKLLWRIIGCCVLIISAKHRILISKN